MTTTLITRLATRSIITQNVMSANTLFQQMQLALLNIGHILSGPRNTALFTSMMALLAVAAVSEWSLGIQDMLPLMMVVSFAWSAWTLQ